jgi:hypothetical protein
MWWQDGLALLMVAGAVFALARIGFSSIRKPRRRDADNRCAETTPLTATTVNCHECALGTCLKTRLMFKKS